MRNCDMGNMCTAAGECWDGAAPLGSQRGADIARDANRHRAMKGQGTRWGVERRRHDYRYIT